MHTDLFVRLIVERCQSAIIENDQLPLSSIDGISPAFAVVVGLGDDCCRVASTLRRRFAHSCEFHRGMPRVNTNAADPSRLGLHKGQCVCWWFFAKTCSMYTNNACIRTFECAQMHWNKHTTCMSNNNGKMCIILETNYMVHMKWFTLAFVQFFFALNKEIRQKRELCAIFCSQCAESYAIYIL